MSSVSSLLRDLETTMVRGSADERTQILSRLTDLFLSTAAVMDEDQVGIFDVVIGRLSRAIELRARIELSERLAPVPNAPAGVVRQLALDEIAVARPVLVASPRLTDQDLVAISAAKGRDHMLAITEREDIAEPVTDFLILRGGRLVTHAIAANHKARFSHHGMGVLVMRANQDDALQTALGDRSDLPAELAAQLMAAAKNSARRRLFADLDPDMAAALGDAVERGARAVAADAEIQGTLDTVNEALTVTKDNLPWVNMREGCAEQVDVGVVANQAGTWPYGRGGWCPGLQVDVWEADLTSGVVMDGANTLAYYGQMDGAPWRPGVGTGARVDMRSWLIYYR